MDIVDFALVHADDAYLDDLGAAKPNLAALDELAVLLLALRQDVDEVPIPELMLVWPNGWAA